MVPFLLSDIPGDVALGMGIFVAGALTSMGAFIRYLVVQIIRLVEASYGFEDAVKENTRATKSLASAKRRGTGETPSID